MLKRLVPVLLLCVPFLSSGQDLPFAGPGHKRSLLNPAYAGADSTLVISAGARLQWPKLNAGMNTGTFSFEMPLEKLHTGIALGLESSSEAGGFAKTSNIQLAIAPHFELFDHRLAVQPGVGIAWRTTTYDLSRLTFGDQIDPRRGFVYNTNEVPIGSRKSTPDINGGLLVFSKTIFVGFVVHHITQPDEGFIGPAPLHARFTAHAGASLGKNWQVIPSLLYSRQAESQQIMGEVSIRCGFGGIGAGYRVDDALIFSGFFQNRYLKVGYFYEYTVSKLENDNTGGSHELHVSVMIDRKKRSCTRLICRAL